MAAGTSSFLEKLLGRLDRLDPEGLQTVVQRLARERRFLETVFDGIEDALVVVDEAGRVQSVNRAATHLLGIAADAAEGRSIQQLLPELDWDGLAALDRKGGRRAARHEFEVLFPRRRLLRLYASPLDGEATGSSGLLLILHDATEAQKRTLEAIENERAQALTLLAASVAHEIGNPLNAIHIHLQLIERELTRLKSAPPSDSSRAARKSRGKQRDRLIPESPPLSVSAGIAASNPLDRIEDYLGVAKGEITRLDYIITQFLQALRPSPPKPMAGSLNEVVRATLDLLKPELDNRGIRVVESFSRQLPEARFDPAQIKQVLVNLAKNAMQASRRGGVLTLTTGAASDGVWVSVADTGGGIPEEQIQRIFEPFYTTKKSGSGLGLLIVQRIVRDHGGRIELENQVGRGATFRIWLPLHERAPRLLSGASASQSP